MSLGIFILASALLVGITQGCGCGCGTGTGNGNGYGHGGSYNDQESLWYSEQIVPDVISYVPAVNATMRFGTGAVVVTGESLSAQQMSSPLTSIDFAFIPGGLYTIVMLDLDWPSVQSPTDSPYVQWLIINVQGQSILSQNLGSGTTVQPYLNPTPAVKTGAHRYLFLVFLQPKWLDIAVNSVSRDNYNVQAFVDEYQLGIAVCGNFCFQWPQSK